MLWLLIYMKYYTDFRKIGNNIHHKYIEDGKKIHQKIKYRPFLFVPDKDGNYSSHDGKRLRQKVYDTMGEAYKDIKFSDGIDGRDIYGLQRFEYVYAMEEYPDQINWSVGQISTLFLDIEVLTGDGFPEPKLANQPITLIGLYYNGKYHVFGNHQNARYLPKNENVIYQHFTSEIKMLSEFMQWFRVADPDIVTGWNSSAFDLPYLYNRIENLFGKKQVNKLSPWGKVTIRDTFDKHFNKEIQNVDIYGTSCIDYIPLYKKFKLKNFPSFSLDYIAGIELGHKKLDYSDFSSLNDMYYNDYERYVDYNIRDVELVVRIDEKTQFLKLLMTIAYRAKVRYEDVLKEVRLWDVIIHNHLYQKGIAVIPMKEQEKSEKYQGAVVKEPIPGRYNWVCSFDLASLYPSLIMQYNISPDTIIKNKKSNLNIDDLISGRYQRESDNDILTSSGYHFSLDRQGFLPELMDGRFKARDKAKSDMKKVEQEIQQIKKDNPEKVSELTKIKDELNALQKALKIELNSAYGAMGTPFMRWYDIKIAESITLSGQLSIKWIERYLNNAMNDYLGTNGKDYICAIDTDSNYLVMEDVVKQDCKGMSQDEIVEYLDNFCRETVQKQWIAHAYESLAKYMNAMKNKMIMKREVISSKAIWTAKKRYLMLVHDDEGTRLSEPEMKVTGMDTVRSTTPIYFKDKLLEAYKYILTEDRQSVKRLLTQVKKDSMTVDIDSICSAGGVSDVVKYTVNNGNGYSSGAPLHVKAAINYNRLLKKYGVDKKYKTINNGDKIKYVYIKKQNPEQIDCIAYLDVIPPEFGIDKYVDRKEQFDRRFKKPVDDLMSVVGWDSRIPEKKLF